MLQTETDEEDPRGDVARGESTRSAVPKSLPEKLEPQTASSRPLRLKGPHVLKRDIGLIVGWSIMMCAIILYDFHVFHLGNPFRMGSWGSPVFSDLDRLALVAMGCAAGILITDVKRLVYGYFTSMVMTILIGAVSIFLYIWFTLQLGQPFQNVSFGWETVLFAAIIKVFAFMIPMGIGFSFMGVIAGNLTLAVTKYT